MNLLRYAAAFGSALPNDGSASITASALSRTILETPRPPRAGRGVKGERIYNGVGAVKDDFGDTAASARRARGQGRAHL